ncbi:MAG: hypothetical protein GX129_01900 [Clostridiales bacterium]|jgi:hypothetical protein|nr:hypothetical protein [Clostridiales bacterium]
MSTQLSFGVKRDDIIDEIAYYFDSNMALDIDEDNLDVSIQRYSRDSRDKAGFVLRKLQDCGWINMDINNSHEQRISFSDYAVELIKTLIAISNKEKIEYQGYIYTIYSLVRTPSNNPGIVLMQIYENTDKLITGLKNLNSNIKRYIDELTKHITISEIMDALFDDYMVNVVDKAYHRLLTSDNVSKFRPEIIDRLEAKKDNSQEIELAARELSEIKDMTLEDSRELVYDNLHSILDAFANMDELLEDIYRKSTAYQKAAVNRARFLLSSGEDVQGQLKEILLYINEEVVKNELELSSIYELEFIDKLIKLFTSGFIDEASFYVPFEGKKEFVPSELLVALIDEEERRIKLDRMMAKLEKAMSVENIEKYVGELLENKEVITASSLDVFSDEDFVRLIYIRLYGQRRKMKYRIKSKAETILHGYRFTDYEIWRR